MLCTCCKLTFYHIIKHENRAKGGNIRSKVPSMLELVGTATQGVFFLLSRQGMSVKC